MHCIDIGTSHGILGPRSKVLLGCDRELPALILSGSWIEEHSERASFSTKVDALPSVQSPVLRRLKTHCDH